MLRTLVVADFALVERLTIDFAPGFIAFTGETGAGKSILLKALGLLLGDRADRDLVRTGAAQARVEGVFTPRDATVEVARGILEEAGVPWEEELLITRIVSSQGGSRALVNGVGVGLNVLAKLGGHLVEVSSQHQHQALLDEENHQMLLDRALDAQGVKAFLNYRAAFLSFTEAVERVRALVKLEAQGVERRDYLKFQVDEVRAANLKPGEEEELTAERDLLANAGKVGAAYAGAYEEVFGGEGSALGRVGRALKHAERAAQFDARGRAALDLLREAQIQLSEASGILRDGAESVSDDPARLDAVESRLAAIDRLKRKHGLTVEAVLEKLARLESELDALENREEALIKARKDEKAASELVAKLSQPLTAARQGAASRFSAQVAQELTQLGFSGEPFAVEITVAEPGPLGADRIRFTFAPNVGEEPKPLASIASGGELSRVLLAVKNAQRDGSVETLVFDEVDAGVGGRTADRVGERLMTLARSAQVVCVTHLPQIAARAASHKRVEKALEGGRTTTRVVDLNGEERVGELARMLGGGEKPDAAWEHARQLAARGALL